EHAPRFPIAKLSGDEMVAAVIASGQTLDNKPIPMSDRDAVWYHGVTRVSVADGDTKDLDLWLDGRAEQGLSMAEAATISLPPGLTVEDMKLEKGPYKLSLNLKARVEKGKTYTFTKFIAMARQNWGGDAKATLELAKAARMKGFD